MSVNVEQVHKNRRETLRWNILSALNIGRPYPIDEETIFATVADKKAPHISPLDVRRELDYLRDRKLVGIRDEDSPNWLVQLTRVGVDLVEYTIPCEPGIARPQKYWS